MRVSDPETQVTNPPAEPLIPHGVDVVTGRRLDALCAAGFLAFALLLNWPILLGGVPVASDALYLWAPWSQIAHSPVNTTYLADSSLLYLPWLSFAREAVQSGVWPMWDPNSFAGFPFAANSQSQLYYPLSWLLWLLPLSGHIQVLALVSIWLAGFGAYLFARRIGASRLGALVGGLAFAGSGMMQLTTDLWAHSSSYAWLPWVLYFTDRALVERHLGWTGAAALSIALQLVSGQLQYAVYTVFVLALWVLWRMVLVYRPWGALRSAEFALRAFCIVGIGIGAALVHLAPLAELITLSGRAGARVSSNSPPLHTLLRAVAPKFFGDGQGVGEPLVFNDLWYAGVTVLFFALLALFVRSLPVVWLWSGLALVSVAVAYGIGPFLYARWLPGLSALLPIRIGYVFIFSVAMLASLGVGSFMAAFKAQRRRAFRALIVSTATIAAALLGGLLLRSGTADEALHALQGEQLWRATILVGTSVVVLVLITLATGGNYPSRTLLVGQGGLVIAAVVIDLATTAPGYNTFVRPGEVVPRSPAVDWLEANAVSGRVIGRGTGSELPALVPNVQTLYAFPSVAGYDSLHTSDYEEFWAAVDPTIARGASSTPYTNVFMRPQAYTSTAAALLGVRYVASTLPLSGTPGMSLAYAGEVLIYEQDLGLPRAFYIARSDVLSREAIVTRLGEPDFDPTDEVLLNFSDEPPVGTEAGEPSGIVPAGITATSLNSVEVRVVAPAEGWLVLGDSHYPGWEATINGRATRVYSAYLALRAVRVPAGESTVRFTYTPATFGFSIPISLASLAIILGLGLWAQLKRKQRMI